MNLFDKAAQFEKLCFALYKRAQKIDPSKPFVFKQPIPSASISGPTPHFTVNELPQQNASPVAAFAQELLTFDLNKYPGVSVDINALKNAGGDLSKAFKENDKNKMIAVLKDIVNLTRDGGGQLYLKAKDLMSKLSPVSQPKPAPLARRAPPSWLDKYMKEEQLKDQADKYQEQMQAALDQGSSVQDALKRQ